MTLAAAREGTRRVAPVWFDDWHALSLRLRQARYRTTRSSEEALDPLFELDLRCDLLVLDDIHREAMTSWKEAVLLHLIRRVEGNLRLVLTTDVAPKDFAIRFGEQAADRLLSESLFALVGVHGPSLRRR